MDTNPQVLSPKILLSNGDGMTQKKFQIDMTKKSTDQQTHPQNITT
jgi:hypothetical protein